MKQKLKDLWNSSGRWFLIGLPIAAVVIAAAAWHAHQTFRPLPQTIAQPPVEQEVTFDMEVNRAYTSEDGIVVIQPSGKEEQTAAQNALKLLEQAAAADPEQVWTESIPLSAEDYTLPSETALADGSIGTLSIPKISLTAPVYETEDGGELEGMTRGVAHFAITSAWDGNIGLSSHNVVPEGAIAYFGQLHLLKEGDRITYKTALGERSYTVSEVKEIPQDNWDYLMRTEDNRITLITCITGKPNLRLMVQAVEV
ncbi:class D sortase [Anaerotruncus sp. AF02-27]|uniref:class D sortase n=1 Tax=Anaerotruncus sp. AF02-27 TaxID=2292191 RepID=UPI000E4E6AC3|nr:class D sortase [Anaerotruncus sp. AF02-27]RGX56803.1 class D sortase [Anaerotruncus sp. AF02-27]